MSPQTRIKKARNLLAEGGRAFDDDDIREGCRFMWEAAKSGISAVAEQRGWSHKTRDDLRHVIHHLDHDGENPPIEVNPLTCYYLKWVVAKMYHEHAVTEDDEWDYDGEFRIHPVSLKYSQKSMRRLIDNLEREISQGADSE